MKAVILYILAYPVILCFGFGWIDGKYDADEAFYKKHNVCEGPSTLAHKYNLLYRAGVSIGCFLHKDIK